MIVPYILGVLIYIFVMLIIGQININPKEKSDFFVVSSITYNIFMGYASVFIYRLSQVYYANIPKGLLGKYILPELEVSFNYFWGTFMIFAYFACLIPINLYMGNRVINGNKIYYKVNFIALFAGALIYCLTK